jgi:ATP-dependent RNA helicase DeaD
VVGTPGRVLDFIQRRVLVLDTVRCAILDEVDRMLDIGFRDDIKSILSRITAPHQTIFVSATIDQEIRSLAKRYMREPLELDVSRDHLTVDEIDQFYVTAEPQDKFRLLRMVLAMDNPPVAIVFCNTKHAARKLAKKLHESGVDAREIHGDLDQRKRERVMAKFRKHQIRVLVATDLAARGIDVSAISHIINYDIPEDPQIYVHRIGRTGRMGARGTAISFVTRSEGSELTKVEILINRQIPARALAGFTASQPRDEAPWPKAAPKPSPPPAHQTSESPVLATSAMPINPPLPKTLGGKFRPSRGGRRRL